MGIEKVENNLRNIAQEIDTYESGISVVTYKYEEEGSENTPVILLPGIRNPKEGEYDIDQIDCLLNEGASEVKYIRYPYDRPLSITDVMDTIDSLLGCDTKLIGVSLGADLIAKYISLDRENSLNILDALLLSPYSIASTNIFTRNALVEKLISLAVYDTEKFQRLYSRMHNGASAPPMFITNCKQLDNIRKGLAFEKREIKNKVPHIKISWTSGGEYSNNAMQRDIENKVSCLTRRFDALTDLDGSHGVMQGDCKEVYTKVIRDWYSI